MKSLGVKPLAKDASPFSWKVTFAPGTLKAVGKNKGKIVAEHELKTAGKPDRIVLSADQSKLSSDFDDAVIVTAVIVDENGIPCPNSDNTISFNVSANGRINSVDNALMQSTEPYKGSERRANRGRAVAVIQADAAKGKIEVSASADGLKSGTVGLDIIPKN